MPSLLSTFILFLELAAKLRLKIWCQACHTLYVVEVRYNANKNRFVSGSGPLAMLYMSCKSWSEALRMYKLCFGMPSAASYIYFHLNVDILYFLRHNIRLEEPKDNRSI